MLVMNERFGRIPARLNNIIKNAGVTPAEVYLMEELGMSHDEMWEHISAHRTGPGSTYVQPWPLLY